MAIFRSEGLQTCLYSLGLAIYFVGQLLSLLALDRAESLLGQIGERVPVVPEVDLGAHEDHGRVGAVVLDLRVPFTRHVLEGGGTGDGEADEEHVGLGVRQRPQPVVVLLSGGVPEAQAHWDSVHDHRG